MKAGLRILPAADADVDALALYIAQGSVEQAIRFYDSVGKTYAAVREHPRRWPIHGFSNPQLSDLRRCSIAGFPKHLVFYRIDDDMVEVVRVFHGARDLPALFRDEASPPTSE